MPDTDFESEEESSQDWRDQAKKDYENIHSRFKGANYGEFQKGNWFGNFAKQILQNYARHVNADYIKRKYPGVDPDTQAKKAIELAAKYCAIAGGLTATAASAAELSLIPTFGTDLSLVVPAVGSAVITDVVFTTRTQIRSTYDLSIIHGAPLSSDDVEDCYLIFMLAMGVKVEEMFGDIAKVAGPRIIAYNTRQVLRSGVRAFMVRVVQRLGGTKLAQKITERALMRLLVPGVSIPIASGLNYFFTKHILGLANKHMRRRGAIVRPLVCLYKLEKELDRTFAIKSLIVLIESAAHNEWSHYQLDALRHCQNTLCLSDEDLTKTEDWFDRDVESFISEAPKLKVKSAEQLIELLIVAAALYPNNSHDVAYSSTISKITNLSKVSRFSVSCVI